MAFLNKIGNLLKQTGSRNVTPKFSASNSSLFQAIRCMSTSSKLFIGGLSYSTDEMSLREAFSQYGEVVEARVILDRETGRSRGFGFVTFTSSEEASSAIQALDGQDLHGRRVRVNHATEKPRGGGFGGGGGFGYGGQGGYYQGGGGGYQGGGGYGGGGNYPSGGGGYGGGYGGGNNYASGGSTDDFSTGGVGGHGAGPAGDSGGSYFGDQTGFAVKEGQEDDHSGAGNKEFGSDDNCGEDNDESKDYANTRN